MNFRTLDLNLLRVFDVVMVERNVTRAAARLAMTQPAVSNALRRLREATHEELFVAGPTGVTPTPHADALWPAVRDALAVLRRALEPQAFEPQRDAREFTLTMADATASVLMPRLLAAFEQAQALATLRVLPLTTRDPRPQLESGHADLALGFFPDVGTALAAEGGTGTCRLQRLYEDDYAGLLRRGHPLAAQTELSLDDFCAARHVRVSFHGRVHGFVDEALAQVGRTRRVALTVNHFSTAVRVVHGSDLLTVVPRSYVPASGLHDGLAVRRLPLALPRIRVALLWHRRHEHDAAQHWLRTTLAEAARGVPAWVQAACGEAGAASGSWPEAARAAKRPPSR